MIKEELIAFLDVIRGQYPNGIPLSAIRRKAGPKPQFQILFIGEQVSGRSGFPDGEAGEILQGAITKGLGISLSEVKYLGIEELASDLVAEAVVLLGDIGSVPILISSSLVVKTCSLEEVLSSADMKRRFWNDLKKLKGVVKGEV